MGGEDTPGWRAPGCPLVPAYYWAGPGSKRVHRMKGFTLGIDEAAYDHAYDEDRLRWLRDAAGVNFLFLTYNWGLPPEIEIEDWEAYSRAVEACRRLGIGTAAYVQASNAVAIGSFRDRDWYAERPGGGRVPYFRGRYFTCLNSEAWRASVHERVADAIARGADAIFLDNCTFGAMPVPLRDDYTGFAGCACRRCERAFEAWQRGLDLRPVAIPSRFRPGRDPAAARYADWRAHVLTTFVSAIAEEMCRRAPAVRLLTNTVGATNLNTRELFGVDLPAITEVVDWTFVENMQLPRVEGDRLVQNASTFLALKALKPEAPALSIAYDRGIGVDGVLAPSAFWHSAAEGFAAGGVPIVRATEFVEDGRWTLLQPGRDEAAAQAVKDIVTFAGAHPDLFEDREPAAAVAILRGRASSGDAGLAVGGGEDLSSVAQALVAHAIPFRVVAPTDELGGVEILLIDAEGEPPAGFAGTVMRFAQLGLPPARSTALLGLADRIEPLIGWLGPKAIDAYFTSRFVRQAADRLDVLMRLVFLARFAPRPLGASALERLRAAQAVRVDCASPVFAALWRTASGLQLHLVNYADEAVAVRLTAAVPPDRVLDVDGGAHDLEGTAFEVPRYAVFEWRDHAADETGDPVPEGATT